MMMLQKNVLNEKKPKNIGLFILCQKYFTQSSAVTRLTFTVVIHRGSQVSININHPKVVGRFGKEVSVFSETKIATNSRRLAAGLLSELSSFLTEEDTRNIWPRIEAFAENGNGHIYKIVQSLNVNCIATVISSQA